MKHTHSHGTRNSNNVIFDEMGYTVPIVCFTFLLIITDMLIDYKIYNNIIIGGQL